MKKKILVFNKLNYLYFILLFSMLFVFTNESIAQGKFFREYWAEFNSAINKKNLNHWRVNDETVALHDRYGKRRETQTNGLILIPLDEDLFMLEKSELYLELWGGHKNTENKRFYLNGRGPYLLPKTGIENGYYSYSFPTILLKIKNMVRGKNAFQFAIDKGRSGWGHYIVKEAALRCYLKKDHPDLLTNGIENFDAVVKVNVEADNISDMTPLTLTFLKKYLPIIDSVKYFARYTGFDDKGLQKDNYWHGITVRRKSVNHVGSSKVAPYNINWDTEMIPDQSGPMAVRAIVYLKNGFQYQTASTSTLFFPKERSSVKMYKCEPFPKYFASRMSSKQTATLTLPSNIKNIEKTELVIKNWGKHKGHNKGPFRLNDKPYSLFTDVVSRIFAFSKININNDDLLPGENKFSVMSDSKHHSLEIFLPGPVLFVKEKKK